MHLNVYSNEGGIKSIEAGKKKAKDDKVYPFIAIYFENGNAIKFFGKTVTEVQSVVDKITEAMESLTMLNNIQTLQGSTSAGPKPKVIAPEFL